MASRRAVTINDVAKLAGVSKSAVSYAMNGQSGVSEQTRNRVLLAAETLGWRPGRSLANDVRTRSVGVVLHSMGDEQFSMESFASGCLAGISRVLEPEDYSITLAVTNSGVSGAAAIHEKWIREHRVEAHMVMGVELGDPRVELFKKHPDVPVLCLSQPQLTHGLPSLFSSDEDGMRRVVKYLYELGHRRIARIAGPERYLHTLVRDRVASEACVHLGMRLDCLHGDFSPESAKMLFSILADFPNPPSAIVCDNDVMAASVLYMALSSGISVPDELSIVSWDDSSLCRICDPPLTALYRDISGIGESAGVLLLRMLSGGSAESATEPPYVLVERASTGTFLER